MPQKTDLYTILYSYARKAGSPSVDMEAFIGFLEKYAKQLCEKKPEWTMWSHETGKKVWMDANHLVEEGKITIESDRAGARVFLCNYYAEIVREGYKNADEDADLPFPTEESLKVIIPKDQIKPLYIPSDLRLFFEEPQEELLPIIKMFFPGSSGSALALAPMIPFTLMEFALLKVRNYLLHHGNREYVHRKLFPQLVGKETQLREILDQIAIRPGDCLNDLKHHREVSFFFWGHFCTLVRTDLSQKTELMPEDIAALQAVYIIDAFSNYMKTRAAKAKEAELVLRNFELEMDKAPYFFTRDSILRFKDNKGVPLLSICSQEDLEAYIRKRSTEPTTPHELPDYVYFRTGDGVSWLIKKTRVLTVCARLFAETRPQVISAIYNRWKIMLREFRKESAMDDDKEFEDLVVEYIKEHAPLLQAILDDEKLLLIDEEMQSSKKNALPSKNAPASSRLFEKNKLLPLRVLLNIKRKQILSDVKLLIPFWYTLFFEIIAFFKKKKKAKRARSEEKKEKKAKENDPLADRELQNKVREAQSKLIPQGQSLDSYLKDVSLRWVELLNQQAYDDLIQDVNRLIRDKLRGLLRIKRHSLTGGDMLDTMAYTIIDSSAGLRRVRDQNSLMLYIKLYIIKLLTAKMSLS